jgi:hypothetical protein
MHVCLINRSRKKIQSIGNALGKAASSLKNTFTPTKGHPNYQYPTEDYGGALKHGVEGMGIKAEEEVVERNAVKEAAGDSYDSAISNRL